MNIAIIRPAVLALAALLAIAAPALAADDPPQIRSFEDLKAETQSRADRNIYPLIGLAAAEVRATLATLDHWDRDAWARAFIAVGDKHLAAASGDKAMADTLAAWRWYAFARWPVTNSADKLRAHQKAAEAFSRYAALVSPRIEEIAIPFEGTSIHANLQVPTSPHPAPLLITIGGVDSWRDGVAISSKAFIDLGIASLAIDMPGTGESPVPNAPGSERMISTILDWLAANRPDIDSKRIVVRGNSWGGYWAARVGYAEPIRLRGIVDQAGPADRYFSRDWQEKSLTTKEYLFDFVQSRLFVWGQQSVATSWDWMQTMSLRSSGLIDKPSPPMLLIDGVNDSQTPVDDLVLLAKHGTPKTLWLNPQGGHMGRSRDYNDDRLLHDVLLPWIRQVLTPR